MVLRIESAPDALPFLLITLLSEHSRLMVEAPSAKEAIALYRALQAFERSSALFNPSFLLMERGDSDSATQQTFAALLDAPPDITVVTPLSRRLKLPERAGEPPLTLEPGALLKLSDFSKLLTQLGYRASAIAQDFGEFAVRGDIIDIAALDAAHGVRVELFDDTVEALSLYNLSSQRSGEAITSCRVMPLLTGSVKGAHWKKRTAELLEGKGTREVLEIEEVIESGAGTPWDMYPLSTGELVLEELLEATLIRWEPLRGELEVTEELARLEAERAARRKNGAFSPFAAAHAFATELPPEMVQISALFSTGSDIKKYAVAHNRLTAQEREFPEILLKRLAEEGAVVLLAPEGKSAFWNDFCVDRDIVSLPSAIIPPKPEPHTVTILEAEPWFAFESVLTLPGAKLSLLSARIFEENRPEPIQLRRRRGPTVEEQGAEIIHPPLNLESLKIGEYIVHYTYGIALYEGMKPMRGSDCLMLRYDNEDRIYLPVYNMHLLYRWRWEEGSFPKISSLRSAAWETARSKIEREIEQVAEKILQLYAERAVETGRVFTVTGEMIEKFYQAFPYRETPDQLRSIREIEQDLAGGKVTDRLLCGDVGFGKTEVAMRGCMIAVASGTQAAVLVPTTVLAFQHYQTFTERFKDFPVRIEMLSRFNTAAEQRATLKALEAGSVDIVIGTHRLLSQDVTYKNLGFLVVDEEHRFGVAQKERIKEIKAGVATLSMTATPIPRTLQLSLLGVRDMSFIRTAPRERKSVRTFILEFSEEVIREAILRELERGGQIYFVHNRIESIPDMKRLLLALIPELSIAVAHGRMEEEELEAVMLDFTARKHNLLLATTLIESGIDIPRVNTIIINRADMFGLAQLYQLRGRVGRWNREAYAYLMVPSLASLPKEAADRLAVIKRFDKLGSGYQVAMEDLNIRGAGNILGFSQSGKLKTVGYDLYLEMLRRRIEFLKTGNTGETREIEIQSELSAMIPETYIADAGVRVSFYRRLGEMEREEEIEWLRGLFTEMYGPIPAEVENLFNLTALRIIARALFASKLILNRDSITVHFAAHAVPVSIDVLFEKVEAQKGTFIPPSGIKLPVSAENPELCRASLKAFTGVFKV